MVDYADIGKRIRACRLSKGMTQEQLANEVGVVVTHISHIETGNSVPSLKTLIDIINALDCSADELLCIEIKKAKPVFDSWMTEQLLNFLLPKNCMKWKSPEQNLLYVREKIHWVCGCWICTCRLKNSHRYFYK